MSKEFKVRKGLIVQGDEGGTVLDVQGTQGQLFSITDDLSDSLYSVNTIAGLPVFEVFADQSIYMGTYNNQELIVTNGQVTIGGDAGGGASLLVDSSTAAGVIQVTTSNSSNDPRVEFTNSSDVIKGGMFYDVSADVLKLQRTIAGGSYDGITIGASGEVAINMAPNGYKLAVTSGIANAGSALWVGTHASYPNIIVGSDVDIRTYPSSSSNIYLKGYTGTGTLRTLVNIQTGAGAAEPTFQIGHASVDTEFLGDFQVTSGSVAFGTAVDNTVGMRLLYDKPNAVYGQSVYMTGTKTETTGSASAVYFFDETWTVAGTGSLSNVLGHQTFVQVSNTNTGNNVRAINARVQTLSSGAASQMAGLTTHFEGNGTGNISAYYGLSVGSKTNVSGFSNTSATLINTYGVYIGGLTAGIQTNPPWGLYQDDTGAHNYFAGNVRVGHTDSRNVALSAQNATSGQAVMALRSTHASGFSGIEFRDISNNVDLYIGLEAADTDARYNAINGAHNFYTASGTRRAVIASNAYAIGIGDYTPKAWESTHAALQLGNNALFAQYNATWFHMASNTYYDGAWKYSMTEEAARMTIDNTGSFIWYTAASGSANATITWSEKLRLTNSGDLQPYRIIQQGSTSSQFYAIEVTRSSTTSSTPDIWGKTGSEGVVLGYDGNTPVFYIANGYAQAISQLSIGQAPSGAAPFTAYHATENTIGQIISGDNGSYIGFIDNTTTSGTVYLGADNNKLRLRFGTNVEFMPAGTLAASIGSTYLWSNTSYGAYVKWGEGSVGAPVYAFKDQADTGMWWDNSLERLNFSVNGTTEAYFHGPGLVVDGNISENGLYVTQATIIDRTILFAPQAYIEAARLDSKWPANDGTANFSYETFNSTTLPFSKVAVQSQYCQLASDFIPVQPGETLYGEFWVMRETGAAGNAGNLYVGIARYDKNKLPIATNTALDYFVASGVTVPTDGVWRKHSGTTNLPSSHTPYNGSDGGPVRYVKFYALINYSTGTIPTKFGGIVLRKQQVFRDGGLVQFGASTRIVHNSGNSAYIQYNSVNNEVELAKVDSNNWALFANNGNTNGWKIGTTGNGIETDSNDYMSFKINGVEWFKYTPAGHSVFPAGQALSWTSTANAYLQESSGALYLGTAGGYFLYGDTARNTILREDLVMATGRTIRTATSDGSDTAYLAFTGGGDESDGRGSIIRSYGNEHATKAGDLYLATGNTTGQQDFIVQGTTKLTLASSGITFPESAASVTIGSTSAASLWVGSNVASQGALLITGGRLYGSYGGETQARFVLDRDAGGSALAGLMLGPGGTTAPDTILYRASSNRFRTDDEFVVNNGIAAGATGFSGSEKFRVVGTSRFENGTATFTSDNIANDVFLHFLNSADAADAYSFGRENDGDFQLVHWTGATVGAGTATSLLFYDVSADQFVVGASTLYETTTRAENRYQVEINGTAIGRWSSDGLKIGGIDASTTNALEVRETAEGIISRFYWDDAGTKRGGGFSADNNSGNRAMIWLDPSGADFVNGDYFYIQKIAGGVVDFSHNEGGDMTWSISGNWYMRLTGPTLIVGNDDTAAYYNERLHVKETFSAATGYEPLAIFRVQQAAATTGTAVGVLGQAYSSAGSGTIAGLVGVNAQGVKQGAGTVTLAKGLGAKVDVDVGTATTVYAIHAENGSVAGTAGTKVGLYIDNQSGASTNYGLYSAHTGAHYITGGLELGGNLTLNNDNDILLDANSVIRVTGHNTNNSIEFYNGGTGAMTINIGASGYNYPFILRQYNQEVFRASSGNMIFDYGTQVHMKGTGTYVNNYWEGGTDSLGLKRDGGTSIVTFNFTNLSVDFAGAIGSSSMSSGALELASTTDQKLTLDKTSGSFWNYIGFEHSGTRRGYFGLDSTGNFTLGTDGPVTYFRPAGTLDLGTSSNRWSTAYVTDINVGDDIILSSALAKIQFAQEGIIEWLFPGEESYKIEHGNSGLYMKQDSQIVFGWGQDKDILVWDGAGTQYAVFDASTKALAIGVGLTVPEASALIHVRASGGSQGITIENDGVNDAWLKFETHVASSAGTWMFSVDGNNTSGHGAGTMIFYRNGGAGEVMWWAPGSNTTNFVGVVRAADGTATDPAFSFATDTNTGFFRGAENRIDVALAGASYYEFSTTSLRLNFSGTAVSPAIFFGNDTNSGLYRVNENEIGISTAGSLGFKVNGSQQGLFSSGNTSAPGIAWLSDVNTGFFLAGEDIMYATAGATNILRISSSFISVSPDGLAPIATGSPGLHVIRDGVDKAQIILSQNGTANASIYFDASNGDLAGSDYFYIEAISGAGNGGRIHLPLAFGNFKFDAQAGVGDYIFSSDGAEWARFDSGNKRLGLGVSAPATKLHVYTGELNYSGIITVQHDTYAAGRYAGIGFKLGNNATKAVINFEDDGAPGNGVGRLIFAVDGAQDANAVSASEGILYVDPTGVRIASQLTVGSSSTEPTVGNTYFTHNTVKQEHFGFTTTLNASDSTTWVTVKSGFGGNCGAVIYGRVGASGDVSMVLIAQSGTTGESTDLKVTDGTGNGLEYRINATDLQVRTTSSGSESATVYTAGIKMYN